MTPAETLDELISNLDPEQVPLKFIVMAKVTDFHGVERIIKGEELELMMEHPEQFEIAEARVILDVRKIRNAIIDEVNFAYDEVNRVIRDSK
jgi:hypothetical protein